MTQLEYLNDPDIIIKMTCLHYTKTELINNELKFHSCNVLEKKN